MMEITCLAEKSHLKSSISDLFNLPIQIVNKMVLNQSLKHKLGSISLSNTPYSSRVAICLSLFPFPHLQINSLPLFKNKEIYKMKIRVYKEIKRIWVTTEMTF